MMLSKECLSADKKKEFKKHGRRDKMRERRQATRNLVEKRKESFFFFFSVFIFVGFFLVLFK